jgi:hypothetical protein
MLDLFGEILDAKVPISRKNLAIERVLDKIIKSEQFDDIDIYLFELLDSIQNGSNNIDFVDLKARIAAEIETEKYKLSLGESSSETPIPLISKLRYVLYILENDSHFNSYTNSTYDVPETYESL